MENWRFKLRSDTLQQLEIPPAEVGGDGLGELDLKRSRGRLEGGCQPRVSGAGREDECKISLRPGLIGKGIFRSQVP